MTDTTLPYAGTEGWSGTDTSRERAETRAVDGSAADVQKTILHEAALAMQDGVTVAELRARLRAHHGTISGCLTALHKGGLIERLAETRNKCKIYVLPQFIQGRETEALVSNKQKAQIAALTEACDALRKAERGSAKMYRPGLRLARAVIQRKIVRIRDE